jgi:uncharacterized BrkB/YihY/UPF0761 family membrane protein
MTSTNEPSIPSTDQKITQIGKAPKGEPPDKSPADTPATLGFQGEVPTELQGEVPTEAGWSVAAITNRVVDMLRTPSAEVAAEVAIDNQPDTVVDRTSDHNGTDQTSTLAKSLGLLTAAVPGYETITKAINGIWENRVREKEYELQQLRDRFDAAEAKRRSQRESFTDKIRSIVLLLVVFALVATPLGIVLRSNITPSDFAQYMAPVTGIAGTIIGYWFGKYEPKS